MAGRPGRYEPYVRLCTERHALDAKSLQNHFAHLCNRCVQVRRRGCCSCAPRSCCTIAQSHDGRNLVLIAACGPAAMVDHKV